MRLPDLAEIVRQMARLDALPDDQYQEIDECLTQLTDIATKRHNLVHRTSNVFDGKLMVTNIMTSKVINASQTEVFEVEEMSNMQSDCGRIYLRLSHIAKPTKSKLDEDPYNAVRMAPWRYKHVPLKTPNLKSRDKSSKTPRAPNASRAARRPFPPSSKGVRDMADTEKAAIDRSDDPSYVRGSEIRQKIAGGVGRPPHVDEDLYDLIIRYAFGDVWSRPGLDIDTRRLLTLAMTIAGGHFEEFKLHLRFALAAGVSRETVKEIMLQSAVYCGIPASLGAFRHAADVYRELDATAD